MNMDLKIVTKEPRKYFNTILFFNSFFPIICYLPVITLYDTGFPREKDIALFLFFFKFLISFFNDCFFFFGSSATVLLGGDCFGLHW